MKKVPKSVVEGEEGQNKDESEVDEDISFSEKKIKIEQIISSRFDDDEESYKEGCISESQVKTIEYY